VFRQTLVQFIRLIRKGKKFFTNLSQLMRVLGEQAVLSQAQHRVLGKLHLLSKITSSVKPEKGLPNCLSHARLITLMILGNSQKLRQIDLFGAEL